MPIYEFYCPENHHIYQFLARSLSHQNKVPRCPENPDYRMERRVSKFAFLKGMSDDQENDPFAGMDDAKLEALMMEMERDISSMDDTNPDPKQLGHLMRKMTGVLGDKAPPEMLEMVRRLEAGEDPEKLEEQFSHLDEDGGEGADFFSQVRKIRASLRAPIRDPKLYDMRDFTD